MWCCGFYEAGYALTPERVRYIVAQSRHLRAFAIYNRIPVDKVLPEDAELLARVGPVDHQELEVDSELRQACLALQNAIQKQQRNTAGKGTDDGGSQTGT